MKSMSSLPETLQRLDALIENQDRAELLDPRLVKFFDLRDAKEAFFTDEAPDALDRAPLPTLDKYEHPEQDPVQALLKKYGVVATDMRHHGSPTAEQLETLLAGVIKSVLPPQEDNGR
ncbi:hypothetical protein ACFYM5_31570 [Streptomyces sp. NPDC006706]|uniref:hypothetical protein n=2 Tax=unclassified Streptomyces TaxID=2593676 RepID=UPI0036B29ACE